MIGETQRRFLRPLALIFLSVIILESMILWKSRANYTRAQAERAASMPQNAILHFDRAVHWYAPLNPWVKKSLGALWSLGQELETTDPQMALFAYDSIRGSVHAIRHFYWPHRDWIARANVPIARLRAQQEVDLAKSEGRAIHPEDSLKFHQNVLKIDERPSAIWSIVVVIAFVVWILSVFLWIFRGFDSEGKMKLKPSLPWIAAVLISFSTWILGLLRA